MKFPPLDVPLVYQGEDGPVSIYALVDPFDRSVRYVGRSVNPRGRLCAHTNDPSGNPRVRRWITGLSRQGGRPILVELERTTEAHFPAAERRWIARYRELGDLYNRRDGAPDGQPARKPEIRRRSSGLRQIFLLRLAPSARLYLEEAAGKLSQQSPAEVGVGPFMRWTAIQEAAKLLGVTLADYEASYEKRTKGGGR